MGENVFFNWMGSFFSTYVATYEGIATLLIFLVLLLKLYINRKTTAIDFKKMLCSIPSEITFLIVGFLLSSLLTSNIVVDIEMLMAYIVISLIILVIQYALERWLDDKIIGKLKIRIWILIILMYVVSGILYMMVVFGGVCNG